MRYKVRCCYDGKDFMGFQAQKNNRTVQVEIEKVLTKFFNQGIKIVFASRTDAKVHAYDQVFHFDTDKEVETKYMLHHLNRMLPDDIKLKSIEKVNELFHSHHNIKYKHYRYLICCDVTDVFKYKYSYVCPFELNYDLLCLTLSQFIGYHDFSSFNSTPYEVKKDQTRKILDIKVRKEGNLIIIDYYGNSFLRHMIRMLTGISVEVARNKIDIDTVKQMLQEPSKTKYRRYNITGEGLYLMKIEYF